MVFTPAKIRKYNEIWKKQGGHFFHSIYCAPIAILALFCLRVMSDFMQL